MGLVGFGMSIIIMWMKGSLGGEEKDLLGDMARASRGELVGVNEESPVGITRV